MFADVEPFKVYECHLTDAHLYFEPPPGAPLISPRISARDKGKKAIGVTFQDHKDVEDDENKITVDKTAQITINKAVQHARPTKRSTRPERRVINYVPFSYIRVNQITNISLPPGHMQASSIKEVNTVEEFKTFIVHQGDVFSSIKENHSSPFLKGCGYGLTPKSEVESEATGQAPLHKGP